MEEDFSIAKCSYPEIRQWVNAPILANEGVGMNNFVPLSLAYGTDLLQKTFQKNDSGGYVKIQFLKKEIKEEENESGWKNKAFTEMLYSVKDLLNKGYQYKDICILVRKNTDGNDLANHVSLARWKYELTIKRPFFRLETI